MQLVLYPSPRTVHKTVPEIAIPKDTRNLEWIQQSGILRVGYHPDNLPFSYFNAAGDLVGFDIDMAHMLAEELNCDLEFVPFDFDTLAEQLDQGQFNFALGGILITTDRLQRMVFSGPVMMANLALIVPDHLRNEFRDFDTMRELEHITIAIPRAKYFSQKMNSSFPKVETVVIESHRAFFENPPQELDAMMTYAECASAWSLLYPHYQVVVPQPVVSLPLAYPVGQRNQEMADFLSQWITLKKHGLEYKAAYDYWILGQGAEEKGPRWSIIRNVLHWVE
jgi:proton glutamate symport protein